MDAVRMDHKGQESRPQRGSMTWGLVKLLNSESQIKVKGDGWAALERMRSMGMRPERRSRWETREDPWSSFLLLSLFPSLWILEPIFFFLQSFSTSFSLPTGFLWSLTLSCPSITSAFPSQPWPPAHPLLSDSEAQSLPLHTSERGRLIDSASRNYYSMVLWVASQPMAGLVFAQVPTPGPISCSLVVMG